MTQPFPRTFLERHYVRFMDAVKPGVAPARLLEADDNARKRKYPQAEVVKFTSPSLRLSHEVYVNLNEVPDIEAERLWNEYNNLRAVEPVSTTITEDEWRVANE